MGDKSLSYVHIPAYEPPQNEGGLLPQRQQPSSYSSDMYSANCPTKKRVWKDFEDKKVWGRRLRNAFIAGGVIMAVLFLFELIVAAIGHCGADVITTTDYTLYTGSSFAVTLEDKGTCPVCAIWAAAYFISSVAFFIMVAAWDRVWIGLTVHKSAGALWCFQSLFCGFACLAVFMMIGMSNIIMFVAVFLIAMIIPILNAMAMIMAAKHDVSVPATPTTGSSSVMKHVNDMRMVMIFIFIIAGILFLALAAFAWAYFANLIDGAGSSHVAGYIYFMIIWKMVFCLVVGFVNVRFANKAQGKKKVESLAGRVVETTFINTIVIIVAAGGFFLAQTIGVHV
jgi:hypothetical protein